MKRLPEAHPDEPSRRSPGCRRATLALGAVFWALLLGCATPDRRRLATSTALAHHEHLRNFEGNCRLTQAAPDSFLFECPETSAVAIQCRVADGMDCCWVPDPMGKRLIEEDWKCEPRRGSGAPKHRYHRPVTNN